MFIYLKFYIITVPWVPGSTVLKKRPSTSLFHKTFYYIIYNFLFGNNIYYYTFFSECLRLLKQLTKKRHVSKRNIPQCLPFESVQQLVDFDNVSDEEYTEVVSIYY